MISIVWEQRVFPVYFELLSKLGSSNFEEQSRIVKKILPIFNSYKICVLGDREFCSIKLATWLKYQALCFCTRLSLLSECPNCGGRFKVPALWVDGWCHRCFMPFGDMVKSQNFIESHNKI